MHHPGPAAIVRMQAGPPQFQQLAARSSQGFEVVFIFGIELSRGPRLVFAHHPIDPDHRVAAGGIEQQQVIEDRVEAVALQPRVVIHAISAAAKFGHEHLVAQPLCRTHVCGIAGKAHGKLRRLRRHGAGPLSALGFYSSRRALGTRNWASRHRFG